jgi:hypothetical protein
MDRQPYVFANRVSGDAQRLHNSFERLPGIPMETVSMSSVIVIALRAMIPPETNTFFWDNPDWRFGQHRRCQGGIN